MDWLTFISSMVDHLVWPVVAVGVFWFLFRNLDTIAEKLDSIKFKDVEFNFRKDVQDLKDKAQALNVTVFYPSERLQAAAPPRRPRGGDRDRRRDTRADFRMGRCAAGFLGNQPHRHSGKNAARQGDQ